MYIINFIRGFLMATADSVPGVSGGTIAFVLGFYDKFIGSINDLISGSKEERIEAITFLAKIGVGWIVGLVLSVLFIASIFEEHIYSISSVFLGLIIVAIPLIIREEKVTLSSKKSNIIFAFIGLLIVFLITYFNPLTNGGGQSTSIDSLNLGIILLVFFAGMIAISAMVLPGISGSTILLILGLYAQIINAVKEIIQFNMSYVPIIFIFGLGILTGAAVTIKLVKKALTNYRSATIYTIIGLMIGSLYAVVMGPASLEIPKDPMTISSFNILFFILGGGLIIGLEQLKNYFQSLGNE
jgi:putative membrane protein